LSRRGRAFLGGSSRLTSPGWTTPLRCGRAWRKGGVWSVKVRTSGIDRGGDSADAETANTNGRAALSRPRPGHGRLIPMSKSKASADPFERHKTRHRGIPSRVREGGGRTYAVYFLGSYLTVGGGER